MLALRCLSLALQAAYWLSEIGQVLSPAFLRLLGASPAALALDKDAAPPTMALSQERSLALGQLHEAIILRAHAEGSNPEDKKEADKQIYKACLKCYDTGISRTEVSTTIKAVAQEFRGVGANLS